MPETGLRTCPPEKSRRVTAFAAEQSVLSSPVCPGRVAKYGHLSQRFRAIGAGFLCTADCVAEGEGFEPPVPFQVQRFSRPPVSTAHASLRVINKSLNYGDILCHCTIIASLLSLNRENV